MSSESPSARAILAEHEELRRDLDQVRELVAALPAAGAHEGWFAALSRHLAILGPKLDQHFRSEERAGFFDEIEAAWPNAAPRCEQLRGEHAELVGRVANVAAAARSAAADPHLVAQQVRALVEALRGHESRETELFQQAIEGGPSGQD
ncbi:MAG: hemerythrin domain-containing protein [Acidobacteria bacterium]|nr:hemerythrin domain-containing protein [Acidobacteriota bacterium]